MNKRELYILVAVLCLLGIGLFLYKALIIKYPLTPASEARAWNIEMRVHFSATSEPAKVYLRIPQSTAEFDIVDEQFISRGYGMSTRRKEGGRRVLWSLRQARGEQVLFYRVKLRQATTMVTSSNKTPAMQKVQLDGAQTMAAEAILAEVRSRSADTETLIAELFGYLNKPASNRDDKLAILIGNQRDIQNKLQTAVDILGLAGTPARTAHGIRLQSMIRTAERVHLLQVFQQGQWHSYDPFSGELANLDNIITWWYDDQPLIQINGGRNASVDIAVSEIQEPALLSASWREKKSSPALAHISLLDLPIDTQAVYQILLTVPVGVLLLVVMRNIVGIKTFGTFMPILIALAFRETQLLWGIFLFSLVVGLGIAIRFYLERLKLLLVPRLSIILISVIIIMTLISIISHKLGLYRGLSIALFPMVILTMTIERMTIVWEERGLREAFEQSIGSLVTATLAYLIMQLDSIQHLVFVFPELLLVLLAIILLLGRYRGYRLLELLRFRALIQERD